MTDRPGITTPGQDERREVTTDRVGSTTLRTQHGPRAPKSKVQQGVDDGQRGIERAP